MEAYANALLFAIPIFMLLVLAEIIYGHFKGMQTYTFMDTISSLSSGLTNIIKDSLGLVLILVSYPYLKSELSLLTIESSIWVYIIAFICVDFSEMNKIISVNYEDMDCTTIEDDLEICEDEYFMSFLRENITLNSKLNIDKLLEKIKIKFFLKN